jgi:cell fate (sporulation/competence/biofilm development) regulator YlbF (YheA/YmcA/DUF963 family)
MDDDEYYNQLTTQAKVRSLNDVASDVREHLSGAVQSIIKAGQALQEGRDMHLSDNAFHDWCMQEFPDLNPKMRERMMQVGRRFGTTFMSHQFPITVLYELAAPSVPDELVEDIMSSDKPMKVKEVQQAKAGYKEVKENPDYGDILEDVKEKRKTPVEAAKEAWDRSEEKRREMENNPNVFDLNAHVKSTEHCTVDVSATNLVVAMEQLISKFDRRDVMMYLYSAIHDDVVNIKIPALHEMSDILIELCEQLPLEGTNKQNLS